MRGLLVTGVSMFFVGLPVVAARMNGKFHIDNVSLLVLISALGLFFVFLGIFFVLEVHIYNVAGHSSKPENQRKELMRNIRHRLTHVTILIAILAFSCAVGLSNKEGRISNNVGLDESLVKLGCRLIALTVGFGILYFLWKTIKSVLAYSDSETTEN